MGMFDYILIDQKLLPYIGNIDSNYFENEEWQTKSLRKALDTVTLTENSLIEVNLSNKEERIITDFHGVINFCTYINKIWYEFEAKYTDGKLVSVVQVLD